jgi:hypothetical protein
VTIYNIIEKYPLNGVDDVRGANPLIDNCDYKAAVASNTKSRTDGCSCDLCEASVSTTKRSSWFGVFLSKHSKRGSLFLTAL